VSGPIGSEDNATGQPYDKLLWGLIRVHDWRGGPLHSTRKLQHVLASVAPPSSRALAPSAAPAATWLLHVHPVWSQQHANAPESPNGSISQGGAFLVMFAVLGPYQTLLNEGELQKASQIVTKYHPTSGPRCTKSANIAPSLCLSWTGTPAELMPAAREESWCHIMLELT
jgi:hypothetical protein